MIPKEYTRDQLFQRKVKLLRDVSNKEGHGVSAGTTATIVDVVRGGEIHIKTDPCPYCGQYAFIAGVPREDLELAEEQEEIKKTAKRHEAVVRIPADLYDRVNRLLSLDSLMGRSDENLEKLGAKTHDCEGIFCVTFDDGSTLNFDLCSGNNNYYDDVVWTNAAGNADVTLECSFILGDIETEIDGEFYIVKVVRETK